MKRYGIEHLSEDLSGVGADLIRSRLGLLCLVLAVGLSSGCAANNTLELRCNLDVPVLLGPPQAIGGQPLTAEPVDEDYVFESSRKEVLEEGRGNLFGATGVANSVVYAGRYSGLMIFVPVSNHWIGVEGEIVQVRPQAGAR